MLADFAFFTDLYKILAFLKAIFSQKVQMPKIFSIDLVSQSRGLPPEYSGLSQKLGGGASKKFNLNFHLQIKDTMAHSNRCYGAKNFRLGSK